MKKLIIALAIFGVSEISYAFCPQNLDKIHARLQEHKVTAVDISYSADQATWESNIKSGLEGKGIEVNATKVDGTDVCRIRPAA